MATKFQTGKEYYGLAYISSESARIRIIVKNVTDKSVVFIDPWTGRKSWRKITQHRNYQSFKYNKWFYTCSEYEIPEGQ